MVSVRILRRARVRRDHEKGVDVSINSKNNKTGCQEAPTSKLPLPEVTNFEGKMIRGRCTIHYRNECELLLVVADGLHVQAKLVLAPTKKLGLANVCLLTILFCWLVSPYHTLFFPIRTKGTQLRMIILY